MPPGRPCCNCPAHEAITPTDGRPREMKGEREMLRNVLIAACLALPLAAVAADDKKATETKEMTPQQQKMASCNKEAGEKKLAGDERKKFMSTCLSADGGKKMTQQ